MALPQRKRFASKVGKPQPARKGASPPVSPARKAAIIAGILLVVVVAVVAVVKFMGKPGTVVTGPGQVAGGAAPSGSAAEVVQGGGSSILTSVVIVPPDPTSRTPLSVAVESSNPGGGVLEITYRWYVDGTLVQEGPSNALQPGPYRKNAKVYAEAVLSGQNADGSSLAAAPVAIGNGQPEITMVTLGPDTAVAGEVLSATPSGTDPDNDPLKYTYQWRVNGNPVGTPGGESSFSTAGLKKRDSVSVVVSCTDGSAAGSAVASNAVSLQNQGPRITSAAPLDLTGGRYVYQVTAKDPDGDPLTYRLDRLPAGMSIDPSSGLVSWELPRGTVYTGRNEVVVAVTVSDGDGGSDSQEFSLVLTDVVVN